MTAGLPERLHAGGREPAMNLPQAMRLQRMALHDGRLPRYLLAPEVAALFSYIPDLQRASLVNLLWNTGARINEALALTPADFVLDDGGQPYVMLKTLKQRTRGRGRPRKDENQVPERSYRLPTGGSSHSCASTWPPSGQSATSRFGR